MPEFHELTSEQLGDILDMALLKIAQILPSGVEAMIVLLDKSSGMIHRASSLDDDATRLLCQFLANVTKEETTSESEFTTIVRRLKD